MQKLPSIKKLITTIVKKYYNVAASKLNKKEKYLCNMTVNWNHALFAVPCSSIKRIHGKKSYKYITNMDP